MTMSYIEGGLTYGVMLQDGSIITNPKQFRAHNEQSESSRAGAYYEGSTIYAVQLDDGCIATNPEGFAAHDSHDQRPQPTPEHMEILLDIASRET